MKLAEKAERWIDTAPFGTVVAVLVLSWAAFTLGALGLGALISWAVGW